MRHFPNKTIPVILVTWLVHSVAPVAAANPLNPDSVRHQVHLLDVGTDTRVVLETKKLLEGAIAAIGKDDFVILQRDGRTETVAYEEVTQLAVRNLRYRASEEKRGTTARSVAAGLGAGSVVEVRTSWGKTFSGPIVQVSDQSFELQSKKQGTTVSIAYRDVEELGTRTSHARMILIVGFILMFRIVLKRFGTLFATAS